ncbi:MAG: NBR1-Ig-like domain-containing protein [Myxococcaceae bacterium]
MRIVWLGCVAWLCSCGTSTAGLSGSEEFEASATSSGLSALQASVVSADFPGQLSCGESGEGRVVMRNSGSRAWTRAEGFKLGAVGDADELFHDDVRVLLPVDSVAPGQSVTFVIPLGAPASARSVHTDWQMVQETVAWFGAKAERDVQVVCGGGPIGGGGGGGGGGSGDVELCAGVAVDLSGQRSASAALQACVDQAREGGVLELPVGQYRMTSQLRIFKPLTVRSQGDGQGSCLGGASCARLVADENLFVTNGFVAIGGSDVVLEHVVLDGNRQARLGSQAAATCAGGNNRVGFNATAQTCERCGFIVSASINALCGSGFEWFGDGARIITSSFRDNGDNAHHMMWSDGLTLLQSDGAVVEGNEFIDNSDIGFISGGARQASFRGNRVVQARQLAFGGLMLDNFNGYTHGDFTGTALAQNDVECSARQCDYGIVVGPHAWYPSSNTRSGEVRDNAVRGAKLGIVVSGGGQADAPVVLSGNQVSGSLANATFQCGARRAGSVVVSPDSFADVSGQAGTIDRFAVTGCP